LELTLARKGRGLFFSAREFLGVGFANILMSLALKIARVDASRLFIAMIIFSRTVLALAIAPSRIDDGRLTDSSSYYRTDWEEAGVVEASFVGTIDGFASMITVRVLVLVLPQVSLAT
jgi:hypothetical protein